MVKIETRITILVDDIVTISCLGFKYNRILYNVYICNKEYLNTFWVLSTNLYKMYLDSESSCNIKCFLHACTDTAG